MNRLLKSEMTKLTRARPLHLIALLMLALSVVTSLSCLSYVNSPQAEELEIVFYGYAAAWVLPEGAAPEGDHWKIISQDRQKYAVVTIVDPFIEPFRTIPNAYKTLMAYMRLNRLEHLEDKDVIACFEREYNRDGTDYMDVYIAVK